MPITYIVVIRPCVNTRGYWAKCDLPNGGCTVHGETLYKTQKNMLEAIELYLEDDESSNIFLDFEVNYA